ncbi:MFS transporter [Nocardia vinacea]|uniref:MFS transporter n=1 Tax=Nocardia vinacea TaxID=96468 RepID=UPI0003063F7C|nr:MFS transporter [Nocardia vinacea]
MPQILVTPPQPSAAAVSAAQPERRPDSHPTAVLLVLALSTFAIVAMQSMVMPILSRLANSLHVSLADASWIITVSMLSAAVFTPVLGSLGDALGRKRVLIVTLALTTIGSVLIATSHLMALVLLGRALQGMGFAAMPLAIGIVRSIFPTERVPSSIALLSALTGIGAGAGLLVSGLLVKAGMSAQGMFWISAAATALGLFGVVALIRIREQAKPFRVDIGGLLTLGGGLVCLVLAINRGSSWGWTSPTVVSLFAGAALLLIGCYFIEQRVSEPLIDMRMMRTPVVLGTNTTALLVGAGMFGAFVLVIQFVQTPSRFGYGFDSDALGAGLTLLPLTAGTLIAAAAVSKLISVVGAKFPMVLGTIVATLTFGFLLLFHTEHWQFYVATCLLGLGLGLAMGAMPTLLNSGVSPEQTSVANSVNQTLRSVGGSIGTAIATAIITTHTIPGTPLPTLDAYNLAFLVSGAVAVVAVIAAAMVPYRHRPIQPESEPPGSTNTRSVEGTVIGAAQSPNPAVTVTAFRANGELLSSTVTDPDGTYRFAALPAEPLTLVVTEIPFVVESISIGVDLTERYDIVLPTNPESHPDDSARAS